jgi:hypothetical protein
LALNGIVQHFFTPLYVRTLSKGGTEMAATIIESLAIALDGLGARPTDLFSSTRMASMSTEEKTVAICGLGAIKHETAGLQMARNAMLDELPGIAYAVVTLFFVLRILSGLL